MIRVQRESFDTGEEILNDGSKGCGLGIELT